MSSRFGWPLVCLSWVLLAGSAGVKKTNRNLLLITLDTFRADYLSINGSSRVQTPHLDRLARGGVNFARARAPVPMTLPAHASILTGQYPPVHGIRDNGSFRLADEEVTLAEVLREKGYETAAFIGAFVLDHRFGLAQGFDLYDDRTWSDVSMLENLEAERNADAVYVAFYEWLNNRDDERPWFAWVHIYDPHAPYAPPEPFRSRYPADAYAGEVAYTDEVVGKIVAALESRNLFARTAIAVVGDHGEGLGDHDEKTHSLLIYNSTLHVPMMIFAPGLVSADQHVRELTRIIDLAPTLLDFLGFGEQLGQGASLRSRIEGKVLDHQIVAYSESLYPRLNLGWSELRGLESGPYRFILAPTPELYDLESDPDETRNLMDSLPDLGRRFRLQLETIVKEMGPETSHTRRALDPETETMLRSLGYVSGRTPPPESSSVDPKTKMAVWNQIQFGIFQFGGGDYRAALETFTQVLASEKDIPIVYEYVGSCHVRLEKWSKAERVYQQALARGIDSAGLHLNLGLIHQNRGELSKAEKELEQALSMDALNVTAHYRLADVYRASRQYPMAIEHFQKALALNPSYVFALNGLGMTLAENDRNEEALEAFRRLVEIDPQGARGYFNLAVLLERMRRNPEALESYRRFMNLSSDEEFSRERERASAAIRRLEEPPR